MGTIVNMLKPSANMKRLRVELGFLHTSCTEAICSSIELEHGDGLCHAALPGCVVLRQVRCKLLASAVVWQAQGGATVLEQKLSQTKGLDCGSCSPFWFPDLIYHTMQL